MLVPDHVRDQVIADLYRRAIDLGWEALPQSARVEAYDRWAADPGIGARLVGFLGSQAKIRSWIKDGPMKHFANARRGAGPYVKYLDTSQVVDVAAKVAAAALGRDWTVHDDSRAVKPLRFVAFGPTGSAAYVCHGPSRKFRDLAWASIQAQVDNAAESFLVVIVDRPGEPTAPAERDRQKAIGSLCGFDVSWVELSRAD